MKKVIGIILCVCMVLSLCGTVLLAVSNFHTLTAVFQGADEAVIQNGCDYIQGYLYSRVLSEKDGRQFYLDSMREAAFT